MLKEILEGCWYNFERQQVMTEKQEKVHHNGLQSVVATPSGRNQKKKFKRKPG